MDASENSEMRIKELVEDIKTLTQRNVEKEMELERYDFFSFFFLLFVLLVLGSGSHDYI